MHVYDQSSILIRCFELSVSATKLCSIIYGFMCLCVRVFVFTLGMGITQGRCPHVTQADCSFTAAVDEQVTVLRVKLGCCDHLCQVLHVYWFNVHNVSLKSKGSNITSAL